MKYEIQHFSVLKCSNMTILHISLTSQIQGLEIPNVEQHLFFQTIAVHF